MSECTHDCANCSANCGGSAQAQPESFLQPLNPLSSVKHVIGVVSGKGGVGKSSVTAMLAVLMQRKGYRAAIMDADLTGPSIPKAFGIQDKAEVNDAGIFPVPSKTGIDVMSINLLLQNTTDPVVWRGPVIAGVVTQFWTEVIWNKVDYLFVDMPPGTGDVPLTVFQSLPVDGIVVVTSPQQLVSMIVEKAVKMAGLLDIPILGLVENLAYLDCPDCGKRLYPFGEGNTAEIAKRFAIGATAQLPINPKIAAACDEGMIELFEGNWLDGIANIIEAIPDKE